MLELDCRSRAVEATEGQTEGPCRGLLLQCGASLHSSLALILSCSGTGRELKSRSLIHLDLQIGW